MLPRSLLAACCLVPACLACSSSSSIPPSPPADASTDGGSFACGTSTCAANQYCVQPCNCGGLAACGALLDGGGCPSGQILQGSCCITPCTEPPPSCEDTPQCGASPMPMSRIVNCPCPG